ncbi:hypothetical protein [Desulfocastanea catecholica]
MKHRIVILSLLMSFFLLIPSETWALGEGEFKPLATGGFGDSANSYTWGLTEFKGNVYASTVRHHLWSVMQAMDGLLPVDFPIATNIQGPSNPEWGSTGYAEEMRGQIWRLKDGTWENVYQSEEFVLETSIDVPEYGVTIPPGTYPVAYGYRTLGTFNGQIYALGVGTWMPPLPFSSIVRSETGDHDDWEDVSGTLKNTTNVRGFVEWRGKVYVSASTPGSDLGVTGGSVVFGSENGENWHAVSEIGFGSPSNVEIYYLTVFNDHLYASTVNYVTGFEVWKTNGAMAGDKLLWTPVVKEGFGDTWNQYGMTMQPFGEYLYIGSAVGIGMVLKDGQPAGTRAIDIIRVDKDDNAELVVGAYFPVDPPTGWPTFRVPLSFMPAGFGNPFNVYTWHMTVYKDWLVLGTLDLSGTLLRSLQELLLEDPAAAMQLLQSMNTTSVTFTSLQLDILNKFDLHDTNQATAASQLIDYIIDMYGGADLWKTKDGINWQPVTLSGFKNPLNYGIRRTVSIPDESGKDHLYIGTANPFTGMPNGGCEVLVTPPPPIKVKAAKK